MRLLLHINRPHAPHTHACSCSQSHSPYTSTEVPSSMRAPRKHSVRGRQEVDVRSSGPSKMSGKPDCRCSAEVMALMRKKRTQDLRALRNRQLAAGSWRSAGQGRRVPMMMTAASIRTRSPGGMYGTVPCGCADRKPGCPSGPSSFRIRTLRGREQASGAHGRPWGVSTWQRRYR